MKKILLLAFMTTITLSYSYSQSSYTFESLSASNPAITYIATIAYDINNNATVSRTTRPSVSGDDITVHVDLPTSDYTLDSSTNSTCITFNIQSQVGYIYYIDENVLLGIANGVCVDCGCAQIMQGQTEGHCKGRSHLLGTGKSQANIIVVCYNVQNCDYCKVVNITDDVANHVGGAVIFKAVSAN